MFKQILSKIPRKSSKSSEHHDHRGVPTAGSNASTSVKKLDPGSKRYGKPNHAHGPGSNGSPNAFQNQASISSKDVDSKIKGILVSSYEALPSFREVPSSEKQNLFIRKLIMCCVVFDFTDPTKNLKEKEIKRQTLLELVDYVSSANGKFSETSMQEVVKMVSSNLFRSLCAQSRENKVTEAFDVEDDEPLMDPSWPHLQIVYELMLRFVASPETDAKLAKRFIDHSFVLKLLDLFDSDDSREREYLKTILHRIYGKFMVHRPFIRKAINNIFYQFIFETEKHNGIAELLEILGSIVNGFALPLKEEHKLFLVRALIPLHKPRCLPMYHQQLCYCIAQFVEKDCKLADIVIRGLLKYWPITNSSKEVMFLSELEEILEATQPPEFQRCVVLLFQQIARCLISPHFQVAERALFLWNNDHIETLIRQNLKVILPIIFPALEKNARSHWNQAVHSLTINVRKIFSELDPELYEECVLKFEEDESKEEEVRTRRETTWKRLEEIAAKKAASNEPVLVSWVTPARTSSVQSTFSIGILIYQLMNGAAVLGRQSVQTVVVVTPQGLCSWVQTLCNILPNRYSCLASAYMKICTNLDCDCASLLRRVLSGTSSRAKDEFGNFLCFCLRGCNSMQSSSSLVSFRWIRVDCKICKKEAPNPVTYNSVFATCMVDMFLYLTGNEDRLGGEMEVSMSLNPGIRVQMKARWRAIEEIQIPCATRRLVIPGAETQKRRRNPHKFVVEAKGKKGMAARQFQRPTPPPLPKIEDDGNPKFVIFIRMANVYLWYPLNLVTGGTTAKIMVAAKDNFLGKYIYKDTLARNLAAVIYKDEKEIQKLAVKQFRILRNATEFRYGYKLVENGNVRAALAPADVIEISLRAFLTKLLWRYKRVIWEADFLKYCPFRGRRNYFLEHEDFMRFSLLKSSFA
ncbi:LOW QUALITY PROTEIN: hypothetical protein V2J09_019907 [Rumex salicifolius]